MKGKLVSVPLFPKLARRLNDDRTPILAVTDLPVNWQDISADPVGQKIGLKWLKAMEYPVLKVPSAIIPVEYNYIINPEHPDLRLNDILVSIFDFDSFEESCKWPFAGLFHFT